MVLIVLAVAVPFLGGCCGQQLQLGPRGPLRLQQAVATQFDPYGDIDAGPEIVGGRPREFQRPSAEPERAWGYGDTRWPF
jgi:hypothetical protein